MTTGTREDFQEASACLHGYQTENNGLLSFILQQGVV